VQCRRKSAYFNKFLGVLGPLFAALIIIWLAFSGHFGLSVDKKLNPVQLLTLAVSVSIAFLVQYFVAASLGNRRAEKNFCLESVKACIDALTDCRREFEDCVDSKKMSAAQKKVILARITQVSNSITELGKVMALSSACKKLHNDCQKLFQPYLTYKTALTGTKYALTRPYTAAHVKEHTIAHRALSDELNRIWFRTNSL
jgi:hypothetical protein